MSFAISDGSCCSQLLSSARWFVEQPALRICVNVGDEAPSFYQWHGAVDLRPHWMVWEDISQVLRTT